MILLVGLGNPGDKYSKTRHNIGFEVVDAISSDNGFSEYKNKFQGSICEGHINSIKTIILKPQTFMNLSGSAVAKLATFYKIHSSDIFVFHDDLDLIVGKIKVKTAGGHAGHNGLKDIDAKIGKEYHRVRIGIDRPSNSGQVSSYVLKKFAKSEIDMIQAVTNSIVRNINVLTDKNFPLFSTKIHEDLKPL